MRERASAAARATGLEDVVEIHSGLFEDLPLPSASVDVVIANGVVNLEPDKLRVFREIARVLRPGGRLYLADVVVRRELKLEVRANWDLWAACIGGALPEPELIEIAALVGLQGGRILESFDCFAATEIGARVATDLDVHAVNFFAAKPAAAAEV
jgi:SAM-dependent methyltransferase